MLLLGKPLDYSMAGVGQDAQYKMTWRNVLILLASCQQTCMTYYYCVHSEKTPVDGQRNCQKNVDFYSKNKFEELVHLVGFIIRTKWRNIFHNKRLVSYPVFRKGQYHIPNRATNLSCMTATCCWYVLENFENYMSFANRRQKNLTLQKCRFV